MSDGIFFEVAMPREQALRVWAAGAEAAAGAFFPAAILDMDQEWIRERCADGDLQSVLERAMSIADSRADGGPAPKTPTIVQLLGCRLIEQVWWETSVCVYLRTMPAGASARERGDWSVGLDGVHVVRAEAMHAAVRVATSALELKGSM